MSEERGSPEHPPDAADNPADREELITQADVALQHAKNKGPNSICLYGKDKVLKTEN